MDIVWLAVAASFGFCFGLAIGGVMGKWKHE